MIRFENVILIAVLSFGSWFVLSIVLGAFAGAGWIGARIGFDAVMWLLK